MTVNSNLSQPSSEAVSLQGITAAARDRAQRHYQRAQEQIKLRNATLAVQELRDAIKIDSNNSEYHALLAKVHLDQGLSGMAKISLRQALKLNPEEPLALECMNRLKFQEDSQQRNSADLGSRLRNFLTRKL